VGVRDLTFLGFPDGRLQADLDLRRDIARVIRRFRPDRVVAQSPSAIGPGSTPATPTIWRPARLPRARLPRRPQPFAFPELLGEGLEPHTCPSCGS